MRRAPIVLVLLCLAPLGVVACGGSEPDPQVVARDEKAVTEVLEDYGAALKARRYDEACTELFAPEFAEKFESAGGCERFLSEGTPEVNELDELMVTDVTVDGDTASAQFTASGSVGGTQVPPGGTAKASLARQGTTWRITALG